MIARFFLALIASFSLAVPVLAFDPPETVKIPEGAFFYGSSPQEREKAYRLDEAAYGHSNTRKWGWYDREPPLTEATLPTFHIMKFPLTNRQYADFVRDTGHRMPDVEKAEWVDYNLIHPFERTRKFAWTENSFPSARADHPVVMVSHADANAYAKWLSEKTGQVWRLPSSLEWEKAMRGSDGWMFPWGDAWDKTKLNSHDNGPFDTVPVGRFGAGASPFGVMDASGQVFEWTSEKAGRDRHFVRGGSWDDSGCGVCRPAAKHARPDHIKHILIGIRLVRE